MEHLTLIIPAKNEKESLPNVLDELKKYNLKISIVLEKEDLDTINSIKEGDELTIKYIISTFIN